MQDLEWFVEKSTKKNLCVLPEKIYSGGAVHESIKAKERQQGSMVHRSGRYGRSIHQQHPPPAVLQP